MRAPIVSRKHYIQNTEFTVASLAVTVQNIVHGVAVQSVDSNFEVTEGSVVKAVYIERWLGGKDLDDFSSVVMILEKAPANADAPTFTNMTTLDAYQNKKNILFSTEGIVSGKGQNPTPFMRGWYKIPKSKQRMGLGDKVRIVIATIGAGDILGCGLSTYKSYS